MKRYVISDLHLGHEAILKYRTQFTCLSEMEITIFKNWNKIVTKEDKVYILGDVAWNKQSLSMMAFMNGKKVLIKGNHDILPLKEYIKYFDDVRGVMEYKGCILTHIPVHESQLERFKINIHGHLHDKGVLKNVMVKVYNDDMKPSFIPKEFVDTRYINVCCEQVNYTPILLEEIINDNDTRD